MKLKYSEICRKAIEVAKTTSDFIVKERKTFDNKHVRNKNFNDLVSYVDEEAEKQLIEGLGKITPEATFLAEETASGEKLSTLTWIIDPIDGTTNYVHGIPIYCISLALWHNGKVKIGIIYECNTNHSYYATDDIQGAFNSGESISVSETNTLSNSLVITGFPYTDFSLYEGYIKVFDHVLRNTHGLRRLGSAALDLAYVACGRFDAFFEYGLKPWDIAAGAYLVEKAGGKVADFKGNNNFLFGKQIIATNNNVYNEFSTIIQQHFNY